MMTWDDLEFSYGGERQFHFPSYKLNAGEQLLISGASGSGKSTWLQLLAGWRRPLSGQVYLDSKPISQMSEKSRAAQIGVMHQNMHFVSSLNALENVKLTAQIGGIETRNDLDSLFEQLGLKGKEKQPVQTLSRGEQQRLSFVRALCSKPKVLLADEPTASLDDKHCHELLRLMRDYTMDNNCILIVVSHDQRLQSSIERRLSL